MSNTSRNHNLYRRGGSNERLVMDLTPLQSLMRNMYAAVWRKSAAMPIASQHPHRRGNTHERFHVHVAVNQLEESIRFYSTLFGHPPSVVKPDYAKWMIEDPRINFAISQRD